MRVSWITTLDNPKASSLLAAAPIYHMHHCPGEGLRAALEAVSYRRELILVTTRGAYHLEFLFQLHNQWLKLGYAHLLALSMEVGAVGR